jgi:DNA-binding NarL/FixJ family response regulator
MARTVTARQIAVIQARIATGTGKGAAHRLGISLSTVNGHLAELRCRLNVDTTEQAVYTLTRDGRLRVPELVA